MIITVRLSRPEIFEAHAGQPIRSSLGAGRFSRRTRETPLSFERYGADLPHRSRRP